MNFEQTPEFSKELKKFSRKWRNISSDLEVFLKAVGTLYEDSNGIPAEHIRESFFAIKNGVVLQKVSSSCEAVKIRMDSSDVNRKILRVIYINTNNKILLIELYSKNDKAREDVNRLNRYMKSLE